MQINASLRPLLVNELKLNPSVFAGKVAIVTGSGRGIGLQVARALAFLGGKVVVAEVSDQGQAAAQAICDEGGHAVFMQTNVASAESVQNLVRDVHRTFGPADIVVNNAIRIDVSPVLAMDDQTWEDILQVNLSGTFRVCKAFLPDMLIKGMGTIINMISSEAMPGLSAYIASKQGVLGFTQSLAIEVGQKGIRVIPFAPGMVDTPGIRGVADSLAPLLGISPEQFLHLSLHKDYEGLMPPEHAGAATAYLAARLADTYHGQQVTGYEVLEQAGLLTMLDPDSQQLEPENHSRVVRSEDRTLMIEKVLTVLHDTALEFEKLPVFVRPIARSGFKSKSGASLEQWKNQLTLLLDSPSIPATPDFITRLEKLVHYYGGVPAETARFTKDTAFLDAVRKTCSARITTIQALIVLLRT